MVVYGRVISFRGVCAHHPTAIITTTTENQGQVKYVPRGEEGMRGEMRIFKECLEEKASIGWWRLVKPE